MALQFIVGVMGSGKTCELIQSYSQREGAVLLKPDIDQKGGKQLLTRNDVSLEVNHLISKKESLLNLRRELATKSLFVDEAQFLSKEQIEELYLYSLVTDVYCYGLRGNFQTNSFEGSQRLFELSDVIYSKNTLCHCGNPANFNARKENGVYVSEGAIVKIDGMSSEIEYVPLCSSCYQKLVLAKDNCSTDGTLECFYGPHRSGKTAIVLRAAYDLQKHGNKFIVVKMSSSKEDYRLESKSLKMSRQADLVMIPTDSFYHPELLATFGHIANIYIDDAHLLTKKQVEELWQLSVQFPIKIHCYGLRLDSRGLAYPGSIRLFELADQFQFLNPNSKEEKVAILTYLTHQNVR